MVGYGSVANLAKRAGMGDNVQATPSIALGSYEATPLDVSGAYTIFANQGIHIRPSFIREVRTRAGDVIYTHQAEAVSVLDPRVSYLMVNLMEEVVRSGTGAGIRSKGFTVPAAGKTGTSHDGWFAGFTSQLLCVVWVGFDDNRELNLEGAKSALPVWTEFMKRALAVAAYRDAKPFRPPPGISSASIDTESGELAAPNCPSTRTEFFISGTEPTERCSRHDVQLVIEEHSEQAQ
jgi:penicillin-binding protein 1B